MANPETRRARAKAKAQGHKIDVIASGLRPPRPRPGKPGRKATNRKA